MAIVLALETLTAQQWVQEIKRDIIIESNSRNAFAWTNEHTSAPEICDFIEAIKMHSIIESLKRLSSNIGTGKQIE